MHVYVSKLAVIGSYNGLSHGWHQAIIWTDAEILLIGPLIGPWNKLQWNFSQNSNIFVKKMQNVVCEMMSILSWPQCDNSEHV